MYADHPARAFGPRALRAVQAEMVRRGWCRTNINKQVSRVRTVFKWATSHELIPPAVYHALATVEGLRRGRTDAPDHAEVRPVPEAYVNAVLPFVSRQVGAMIRLQLLTGMRPGEVVIMRGADIDTTGKLWVYAPAEHKTAHHGHARTIYLGRRRSRWSGHSCARIWPPRSSRRRKQKRNGLLNYTQRVRHR